MSAPYVTVIGGGLAGSEAAWQLARRGHRVRLVEMKPGKRTPAQTSEWLAELVCSNSFRSDNPANAIGLLHEELRRAGSLIFAAAERSRVPAGDALAVDRVQFAEWITGEIEACPSIERIHAEADRLPEGPAPSIVATGPLTSDALAREIAASTGSDSGLYFYDAIAPIVDAESIDHGIAFAQSRNDKGGADYLNLPLTESLYHAFVDALLAAEKVQPHAFEEPKYFDGCLPIEVIAERGRESLVFGPMKARGLRDPRTGERPYAVVQLRREDVAGTSYNLVGFQTRLTWPEQRRILRTLPGLENAEFLRMGQIHRNTFLDGPSLLSTDLSLRALPHLFFAGQIAGVEGYVESTALGLLAALAVDARLSGRAWQAPPPGTAFGALIGHVSGSAHPPGYDYQPTNITWALFPPLAGEVHKTERRPRLVERARAALTAWGEQNGLALEAAPTLEVPALPKRKSRRAKVRERAAAARAALDLASVAAEAASGSPSAALDSGAATPIAQSGQVGSDEVAPAAPSVLVDPDEVVTVAPSAPLESDEAANAPALIDTPSPIGGERTARRQNPG